MALAPGTRLGPYQLDSQIGAGGMGEVYRALDTRLHRNVAVKILPAALAADPELRDRFAREARVISSLNHPNICTLFDVGEAPAENRAVHFLVLELLDGETASERLARSGPLPVADALKITTDICAALDRAHRSGIVHRDLKPGNVFLVRAGGSGPPTAKLLDFGLAKGASPVAPANGLSMPTTPAGLTVQGTILGTFQYMAPEQIEGLDADARSDIFALGATVFEMLTGRPAFEGKTRAALLGAILKDEPPAASSLRPGIPAHLDRVIATCLAKDPDDRWQSARDVLHALRLAPPAAAFPVVAQPRPERRRAWWAAAALIGVALAAGGFVLGSRRSVVPAAQSVALTVAPPPAGSFETLPTAGTGTAPQAALSPDGTHLVFVGSTAAGIQLWLRPMSSVDARPIAGSEDAAFPFWSPDSQSIAFFARGKLRRVSRDGGPVVDICEAVSGRGGTWSPEGVIVFAPDPTSALKRVHVANGVPSAASQLDNEYGETGHRFPWFLPDGRHFLYTASVGICCPPAKPARVRIGVLDSDETSTVLEAESSAVYTSGHILINRDGVLLARPFDLASRSVKGEGFPITNGIFSEGSRYGSFSASSSGALAYSIGVPPLKQLTWFDRSGKPLGRVGEPASYFSVSLSSDDSTVVAPILGDSATSQNRRNVHVIAMSSGERRQLTFEAAPDNVAVWSPDNRQIAFGSIRGGIPVLRLLTLATMQEETVLDGKAGEGAFIPSDWSRTAGIFYGRSSGMNGSTDIWTVSLSDRTPKPYVQTPVGDTNAVLSPDGHWVAYESIEPDAVKIVVRPYPPTSERHVIAGYGSQPLWSADGKELFYITQMGDALMAVKIEELNPFRSSQPRRLFPVRTAPPGGLARHYAVSRDGKRFLVSVRQPASVTPWVVLTNPFAPPR